MEEKDVVDRMNNVFREVFDNPTIEIFDEMTASDVVCREEFVPEQPPAGLHERDLLLDCALGSGVEVNTVHPADAV